MLEADSATPEASSDGSADQGVESDGAGGIQGLRDGLAALASLPGAANERLGVERDAVNSLRVTAAQVVAGSQYVYNVGAGRNPLGLYRMSSEEIEETREAFVRPAGYPQLVGVSRSQALVLLSGPAGAGKCA